MNIIIWLVIGGLIGWVASLFMRTDGMEGILLNMAVGIIGAVLGGWFSALVGVSIISQGNFSGAGLSLAGAVILLTLVNVFRRSALR
jgi:uncharacterized membrane protein YeaQ/YmgE (transglycosylase-associated protein family)